MATLKVLVDEICGQLEITVQGSLKERLTACAEAAGLTFKTIKVTADELAVEVLGRAPAAPAAAPAALPAPATPAAPRALAAPAAPAAAIVTPPEADRKRPREDESSDDDAVLVKVQTAKERAAESKARAEAEGRVDEISSDDEPAPAPKRKAAPAKAPEAKKPRQGAAPCVCSSLVANYSNTRECKAKEHDCPLRVEMNLLSTLVEE